MPGDDFSPSVSVCALRRHVSPNTEDHSARRIAIGAFFVLVEIGLARSQSARGCGARLRGSFSRFIPADGLGVEEDHDLGAGGIGARYAEVEQPPFLSRMPGWIPAEMISDWPSGQFLTVCSRWVWVASGTSMGSRWRRLRAGRSPWCGGAIRTVLTVRSIMASSVLPSKVKRGLILRVIPSSSCSGRA